MPGPTSTITAHVEGLDLATVLRVSQAVSGEIVLEKLIDRLMCAAIEHAGAERGLLIGPRGEELQIDAQATARGEDVAVQVRERGCRLSEDTPSRRAERSPLSPAVRACASRARAIPAGTT